MLGGYYKLKLLYISGSCCGVTLRHVVLLFWPERRSIKGSLSCADSMLKVLCVGLGGI